MSTKILTDTQEIVASPNQQNSIPRYLSLMVDEQLASGTSVYEKKLSAIPPEPGYDKVPHTIYYYYLRIEADSQITVWHYRHISPFPIAYAGLQAAVTDVAQRAMDGTLEKDGESFEFVKWERKSYIVFLIDEEHWEYPNGTSLDAILIEDSNHTFFDAKSFSVPIRDAQGAVRQRPVVAMVNHMKQDNNGGDLPPGISQTFKFSILFNVRFTNRPAGGMVVVFDPSGTNTGPPLPPPG